MRNIFTLYCIAIMLSSSLPSFGQDDGSEIKITRRYIAKNNLDILQEIAEENKLKLDYNPELVKKKFISGISFQDESLSAVIDKLLDDQSLHFRIFENTIVIKPKSENFSEYIIPERFNFSLNGKIIDQESGETLPFANIGIRSSSKGTTTNTGGYFTLFNVPTDTSVLIVNYIGYEKKEVRLTPQMVREKMVSIELKSVSTQLDEIVIKENKESMIRLSDRISSVSISPAQISSIPSLGEKDIFRSLQLLPGISATNETSSGLYVRGGTPDQNLILFDGFTVYHVDHFYGFFSAFNTNAIKDVQLYKGGFEAKYGGRLSSVVDLIGKTGNTNKVSGAAGVSALSANAALEIPFAKGKGTFLVAGRRSYTDIIKSGIYNKVFNLFNEEEENNVPGIGQGPGGFGGGFGQNQVEPAFYYYDFNSKLSYRPSAKDIITISFYKGQDNLDQSSELNSNSFGGGFGGFPGGGNSGTTNQFENSNTDITKWGNTGTSLQWGRQWNSRSYSNVVVAYSKYFSNRDVYSESEITRDDSTFTTKNGNIERNNLNDISIKIDNEYLINDDNHLGYGIQFTNNDINYNLQINDTLQILNRKDRGNTYAAYLQNTWTPLQKLSVTPGIRISYFDVTEKTYFEPRISGSYQFTEKVKLKAAWGKYYQFVSRIVREDLSQGSRDFWLLNNNDQNPVSSAYHYIIGATYEVKDYLFDVEAYYKDMYGLTEYSLRFSNNRMGSGPSELFFQGTGYAKGIDFLLQKKFGNYTGWIGYTLGEVVYDFPEISDEPYHALHDQTHEFKSVNILQLGRWTLGGTWVYATGKPYTSPIGRYSLTLLDGSSNDYISVGQKNAYRLPAYHRLDVSITYNTKIGKAKTDFGLSIFNLYNRSNIWYKKFEVIDDTLVTTDVETLGITPNLFVNIKF